eukprot:g24679.t1
MVETSATTGKSIINLSDHTLQPAEYEGLSQGLNFCPTTKVDPTGLTADTQEFIGRVRLQEFFHKAQNVSSEPNETADDPEQSTERFVVQRPKKKESNWIPPEGCCPRLDMYAQGIRRCVNARFISPSHKVAQNVTLAQRNAIYAHKTNCNIVKPADKGGAIDIKNKTDYCKEAHQQLNNQEHYRLLPTDPTKEHTCQLNRLIMTFHPDLQRTLRTLVLHTYCIGDFYSLPKIHKANTPGRPIVSGNGTLLESLSGYVEDILKPI